MSEAQPVLHGVHHTARPTWKLRETVEFYRDKLGLPLIHAISARGWGPSNHPDFLHFFFGSGKGSTIAFFYYIGADQPDYTIPRDDYRYEASHTAWQVHSHEELKAWRDRIEAHNIPIIFQIRHELIESIYFRDPNGYYLEITLELRDMNALDAADATRTLEAAMAQEDEALRGGSRFTSIDQVWRRKARNLAGDRSGGSPLAAIFVLDVPEFQPLVAACRRNERCSVEGPVEGYWRVSSPEPIVFERKALGLIPALWNAALTGGFEGNVKVFDRNVLEVTPGVQA